MIHFERHGSGKPLLFIHGAGGSTTVWRFQREQLSDRFETVVVDLPGHGRSSGKSCDTIEGYGLSVSEVMEHAKLDKPFLVGHSMGGAIAMHLALNNPSSLSGLVLVGTGAKLAVLPAILEGIMKDKTTTCRMIVDSVFSPKAPAPMREASYREYVKTEAAVIHADFAACNGFDMRQSLQKISLPTLILCGTDDTMTPPRYAEYLHDHIDGSVLRLIGDAGHMAMVEKPREVNEAIARFAATAP